MGQIDATCKGNHLMRSKRAVEVLRCLSRTLVVTVVLTGLLLSAGCERGATVPPQREPTERTLAAAFLKQHGLQGRAVLVEFGTIGCELSGEGLDDMIDMHRDEAVAGLAYVRVEASGDAEAVARYYAAKKPGFPVHRDADASLARACDATAYPTFVLLDKFGRVRYRGGMPDELELSGWVGVLLAEKADAGPDVALFGKSRPDASKLLASTKLPDLAGVVKPLDAYLGRNGLLLVFVDTSCPFSGTAIGETPEVARTLTGHRVTSVTVNLGNPKDDVLKFYAKRETGTPVVYDVTDGTTESWQLESVPTLVFFDAKGQVLYRGKAVWGDMAVAAERGLGLAAGSLKFEVKGTEFG